MWPSARCSWRPGLQYSLHKALATWAGVGECPAGHSCTHVSAQIRVVATPAGCQQVFSQCVLTASLLALLLCGSCSAATALLAVWAKGSGRNASSPSSLPVGPVQTWTARALRSHDSKLTTSLLTFKLRFPNSDTLRTLDFHGCPGGQVTAAHVLTRAGNQEAAGYPPPRLGDTVSVMLIQPFHCQAEQLSLNCSLDFVQKGRKASVRPVLENEKANFKHDLTKTPEPRCVGNTRIQRTALSVTAIVYSTPNRLHLLGAAGVSLPRALQQTGQK